jgi:hypothetical protein
MKVPLIPYRFIIGMALSRCDGRLSSNLRLTAAVRPPYQGEILGGSTGEEASTYEGIVIMIIRIIRAR